MAARCVLKQPPAEVIALLTWRVSPKACPTPFHRGNNRADAEMEVRFNCCSSLFRDRNSWRCPDVLTTTDTGFRTIVMRVVFVDDVQRMG
jgi:hypothetical protein